MSQQSNRETYTPSTLPENLKGKKVVLVNHSDTLGGAAIVTFRLMQALRQIGVDARMVVFTKTSEEDNVSVIYTRFFRSMAFCLERARILPAIGFNYDNLFKVSTGDFALNIHRHPWIKEADIVCLNWINQGLMSMSGLLKLHQMGKKIVWTIHDMWTMTGICHHAYECDHYLDECGCCQFLAGGGSPHDLSHKLWKKKMEVYNQVPVTFITVSNWLEKCARHSSLLKDREIVTIHNPFPIEQFYFTPPRDLYAFMPPLKTNILLFGAARIDDPIKGLDYTIDALNYIFDNYPDIASVTAIYFFGSMKNPQSLDRLRFSHRHFGLVSDFKILRYLYSISKVVISTSLYETLGGTLVEGQAGGALPVTFGGDGRNDVVEHLKTGYIARYKDPIDVANGIMWALKSGISRESLHQSVADRFASPLIASRYADVLSKTLNS
ncbi:MAG: glycosyltransferase [Bacteroides sp.]|nr:glycosyltransferase [Bacteroides sp.]